MLNPQVERAVEQELYSALSTACQSERQRRATIEGQMAYASSAGKEKLRQRLEAAKTPSCEAFAQYFKG